MGDRQRAVPPGTSDIKIALVRQNYLVRRAFAFLKTPWKRMVLIFMWMLEETWTKAWRQVVKCTGSYRWLSLGTAWGRGGTWLQLERVHKSQNQRPKYGGPQAFVTKTRSVGAPCYPKASYETELWAGPVGRKCRWPWAGLHRGKMRVNTHCGKLVCILFLQCGKWK